MKVLQISLTSRILLILFSFISNELFFDYDSSTSIFLNSLKFQSNFQTNITEQNTNPIHFEQHQHFQEYNNDSKCNHYLDFYIFKIFGSLTNWDAVYFIWIAQFGYIYEQSFAFFPLLSTLMNIVSNFFFQIINFLGLFILGNHIMCFKSVLILIGVIIVNGAYILASVELFYLTKKLFKREDVAFLSFIFFIISPANIFLTAIYTESLFCYLSWKGFNYFTEGNWIKTTIFWSACSLIRSNAILYCGFFGFEFLKILKNRGSFKHLLQTVLSSFFILLPYILFQYYGYFIFCKINPNPRPWCFDQLPHLYPFVQENYWNQGFLRYWKLKQLPNFLIAAPLTLISFYGIYLYFSKNIFFFKNNQKKQEYKEKEKYKMNFYFENWLLPYILYWFGFVILILLNFHVQTMTRMLASTLPFYWFLSYLYLRETRNTPSLFLKGIFLYCILWTFFGVTLFSNFYPWT